MIKNIIVIVLGAIILCFTSFYNRFPLLTGNSGVYLNSAFGRDINNGSASVYGFFIAHSSWGFSLWLVVFCQALMLSLIIYYYFRYFSYSAMFRVYYLAFVFCIAFFTSASIAVSTIDTGVFSCMSTLSVGLLLLAPEISKRDVFITCSIALLSMAVSTVNLLATGGLILIFTISLATRLSLLNFDYVKTSWRRIGVGVATVAISWILGAAGHAVYKPSTNKLPLPHDQIYKGSPADDPGGGHFWGRQIFITGYSSGIKETVTFSAVSEWYNWELREACLSKQYFFGLRFVSLSYVQLVVCMVSVLLFIYLSSATAIRKYYMVFIYAIAGFWVFQITVYVWGEKSSYGWQMLWLSMLPLFVAIGGYKRNIISQVVNHTNSLNVCTIP